MTSLQISRDDPVFSSVKDKVVILTGGSTGIGAATVRLLNKLGAIVSFLDLDKEHGEALAKELSNVTFYPGSVTKWADQLVLFEGTVQKHGRVDIVLANAGIDEVHEDVFADSWEGQGENKKLKEPTLVVLDVTLRGVVLTAKLALSYFRRLGIQGSLVATGSAASYLDTQGIPIYNAAKHGILGLVRSLRDTLTAEGKGLRVNLVAPAFVQTAFTAHLLAIWQREHLPINQPEDVALAIVFLAVNTAYQGRSIYVAGGTYTELEGPLEETRDVWLGKQNNAWNNQRKSIGIKLGKQE